MKSLRKWSGTLVLIAATASLNSCDGRLLGLANALLVVSAIPASLQVTVDEVPPTCADGGQLLVKIVLSDDAPTDGVVRVEFEGIPEGVVLYLCDGDTEKETSRVSFHEGDSDYKGDDSRWRIVATSTASAGSYTLVIHADFTHTFDRIKKDHHTTLQLTILAPPDASAPVVAITLPANQSTVTQSSVSVAGTAIDNVGVESIGYALNGGPEHAVSVSSPITDWAFDVPDLTPGPNTIEVLARDAAGNPGAASVMVEYVPVATQLACHDVVEAGLRLGESAEYDLGVPATDFTYAFRIESVDFDGNYEFRQDDVVQFGGPAGPGFLFDRFDFQVSGARYTIAVSADNAGGTYRLYLECERPLSLNTNVAVTQLGGLAQLYRFAGQADPIHVGVHRPQVVNDVAGTIWYDGGTIDLFPAGNPSGGYYTEYRVQALQAVTAEHTVHWRVFGSSPSDVDEYTFAISTVQPPTALSLNASNTATVNADVQHLGQLRYYSFQGLAGETYTLTLDHPSGSLAAEAVVERMGPSSPFYQSPYVPLATGATTRDPAERTVTLGPFVLPADGTYTIRVGANSSITYDAALAETTGAFTLMLERQ